MARKAWTTHNEMEFINNLSEWNEMRYSGLNHRQLLKRYVGAIDNRKDWGDVDKSEIKAYAEMRLGYMERYPCIALGPNR